MTLDDWLAYPIWERLPENRRRDELWVRPIIEPTYLKRELLRGGPLYVLVKSEHPVRYGIAGIWNERRLDPPSLWWRGGWTRLDKIKAVKYPFYFTVVPAILGKESVRFVVSSRKSRYATRAK